MFSATPQEKPSKESCCSTPTSTESCSTLSSSSHDCCTPQPKGKVSCPTCEEKAKGVLAKTVNALITDEAKVNLSCMDGFYYCKTPSCKTIYFRDKTVLTQDDMSVIVGLKDGASPATVCYCFGWTKEKIKAELKENGHSLALEDIKAKMENPGCSCEILNPSGGCCLGDTGQAIKEIKRELGL
jgi:hypothetical protein